MKTLLITILATVFVACGQSRELAPAEYLGELSAEIWQESNKAQLWLDRARNAFYPEGPEFDKVLEINEQTADCLAESKLPDSFFKHLHSKNRAIPNQAFFATMAEHYQGEISCYKTHNEQIKALLGGDL